MFGAGPFQTILAALLVPTGFILGANTAYDWARGIKPGPESGPGVKKISHSNSLAQPNPSLTYADVPREALLAPPYTPNALTTGAQNNQYIT